MEGKQWKYKIGSGKMPMILTLIMFALFGGLSIWLYSVQNGAFLFTGALAVATLILLGATIHRFLFYKVFIGKDGFYYQTGRKNGIYYTYENIEKAWISSGTAQNGFQEEYCNVEIENGPVIRFQFFNNDKKGIKYLIKQAEVCRSREMKGNTFSCDLHQQPQTEKKVDQVCHGEADKISQHSILRQQQPEENHIQCGCQDIIAYTDFLLS